MQDDITSEDFKNTYNRWIEEALRINRHVRDRKWTQSVAVGGIEFVEITKDRSDLLVFLPETELNL